MKRLFLLSLFLVSTTFIRGQKLPKFTSILSSNELTNLDSIDVKEDYLLHDFSDLLLPQTDFIGYFFSEESSFARIDFTFNSITKDAEKPSIYHVEGVSN